MCRDVGGMTRNDLSLAIPTKRRSVGFKSSRIHSRHTIMRLFLTNTFKSVSQVSSMFDSRSMKESFFLKMKGYEFFSLKVTILVDVC